MELRGGVVSWFFFRSIGRVEGQDWMEELFGLRSEERWLVG